MLPATTNELPYLIAGLGNPGREYAGNRHNVGFMLVDHLAARLGANFSRLESKALVCKTEYQGRRLILAKPQTFMNLSGQAVAALVHYYKIPLEHLLVAYDDVDLPLGTLRLRPGGGSAGQKGMKSILERLGSVRPDEPALGAAKGRADIPRLRIGIDRPPGRMDAAAYVLQDFSRQQAEFLPVVLDRGVDAALVFVTQGLEAAMNQFNAPVE